MLVKLVPMLKGSEAKIAMLIEEAVLAMDASLKKSLNEPQP